jgi:CheY-like chemotaxis protein
LIDCRLVKRPAAASLAAGLLTLAFYRIFAKDFRPSRNRPPEQNFTEFTEFKSVDTKRLMESQSAPTPTSVVKILLVEDDAVDVMNVQRAFRKRNISVPLYLAENGLEAIRKLRGSPPEISSDGLLILLDINMPAMNGLEFLQELRSDPSLKSIPTIILTTSNQAEDLTAAYQLNVAGYLVKPVLFTNFVKLMDLMIQYWSLSKMP